MDNLAHMIHEAENLRLHLEARRYLFFEQVIARR